ncbi:MAG: PilZ domain-containing protein [Candidatus Sumerlaeota bacterium]
MTIDSLPTPGQSISFFRLSDPSRSMVSGKVVDLDGEIIWIDLPPGKQIPRVNKLVGSEFVIRWEAGGSAHDMPVVVEKASGKGLGLAPRHEERREYLRIESSLPMEFRIVHEGDRESAEREVMSSAAESSDLQIEADRFWHQDDLGERLEGEFGQIGRFLKQLDAKLDYLIDLSEGKRPRQRPAHRVHSLDISGGGISFIYDQPVEIETLLMVTVELSQYPHAEAKALGKVVRCLPAKTDKKAEYEIGVHFELIRDDSQELIFRYISRAERKMLRMRRELFSD